VGADLFGIILFGPMRLDATKILTAKKFYEGLREQMKAAPRFTFVGPFVSEEMFSSELLEMLDTYVNDGHMCDDVSWLTVLEEVLELDENLVAQTVDAWQHAGARDQMSRQIPDQISGVYGKWKCVVAGMTSWGDEPDEHSSQVLLGRADSLGILTLLGIY
jgi:hypothetical protein